MIQYVLPESISPFDSYKTVYDIAKAQGLIRPLLQYQISHIFAQMSHDVEGIKLSSAGERGAWQSGYYLALHNKPIPKADEHNNEIVELRATLGLTQAQFAQAAGVSHGAITKVECGQRKISKELMERIRRAVTQIRAQ